MVWFLCEQIWLADLARQEWIARSEYIDTKSSFNSSTSHKKYAMQQV